MALVTAKSSPALLRVGSSIYYLEADEAYAIAKILSKAEQLSDHFDGTFSKSPSPSGTSIDFPASLQLREAPQND